jgi:transposase
MAPRLQAYIVALIDASLRDYMQLNESPDYEGMALLFNCQVGTIRYHQRRIAGIDSMQVDMRRKPGPSRIIQPYMEVAIVELLAGKPDTYQDEIVHFLWDEFEVEASQTAVSRCLKDLRITRRKMKVVAAQQNDELRLR